MQQYRVVEICAGAGGQSLGLEMAGFEHELAVELDPNAPWSQARVMIPSLPGVHASCDRPYVGTPRSAIRLDNETFSLQF